MHIGYQYDADGNDTGWGKGSPIKVGIEIEWDSLAFWRKTPHPHIPERSHLVWFGNSEVVNARCTRCQRWLNIETRRLVPKLNKTERD